MLDKKSPTNLRLGNLDDLNLINLWSQSEVIEFNHKEWKIQAATKPTGLRKKRNLTYK